MTILQMFTFLGCGGVLAIALLLWFLAHKAAAVDSHLEAGFTRLLAFFFTGIGGGLMMLALNLSV